MRNWRHYVLALLVGASAGLVVLAGQVGIQHWQEGSKPPPPKKQMFHDSVPDEYKAGMQVYHSSLGFGLLGFIPQDRSSLVQRENSLPVLPHRGANLYYYFTAVNPAATAVYDEQDIRLVVRYKNGEVVSVDGEGCVRWGRRTWQMTPRAFAMLCNEITIMRYVQEQKRKQVGAFEGDKEFDILGVEYLRW